MKDIVEWLESLDLGEYAQRFSENAIDLSVIRDLTENDLKELGVLLGHRRKMLRAIAKLQRAGASIPQMASDSGRERAERRQLTVMFCDLVGSTALAARLDPEDMRQVMALFHRRVAEVIGGYEGVVARFMGDGVLAYFGYPEAHEDDAVQAVRAGLALVDSVSNLQTGRSSPLQIRVGIATGLTVVGDLIGEGGAREEAVVGDTPNLAARLQALAEPGTVMISAATRRLTAGQFTYRDRGPVALKGWTQPVPAWQVLGTSGVESRFEAQHESKPTPLFGR